MEFETVQMFLWFAVPTWAGLYALWYKVGKLEGKVNKYITLNNSRGGKSA